MKESKETCSRPGCFLWNTAILPAMAYTMTANTSRRSCHPVPSIALKSTRLSGARNTSPCTLTMRRGKISGDWCWWIMTTWQVRNTVVIIILIIALIIILSSSHYHRVRKSVRVMRTYLFPSRIFPYARHALYVHILLFRVSEGAYEGRRRWWWTSRKWRKWWKERKTTEKIKARTVQVGQTEE